jgi:hypothetical protein
MNTKPITGTFTGIATSETSNMYKSFNISLSGTFVADIILERSFDQGVTWLQIIGYTNGIETQHNEPESNVLYRFNCTGYTSGSVIYRISR